MLWVPSERGLLREPAATPGAGAGAGQSSFPSTSCTPELSQQRTFNK